MHGPTDTDRFELLERVGAGGSGAVYRARDRLSGRFVAYKELHGLSSDDGVRFARECALLATLTAPGIVRYVAHGLDRQPWLAMEWVEGPTLSKVLKQRGLSWTESLDLTRKVASAVGALHQRGIVHRDIKPGNVILEDGDASRPRLIDLGIARPEGEPITMTGVVVGTAGYMAPEQARGLSGIDARADVFALGCLLFRCLTGRTPFTGEDALSVMLKVSLEDAPLASEIDSRIPDELDELCGKLLTRDRDLRPRDGFEVATLVTELGEIESVPSRRSYSDLGAVTTTERRLVFLVLIRPERGDTKLERALEPMLAPLGLTFDTIAGGTVVLTSAAKGKAGDLAFRAARAALAARAASPRSRATISIGRAAESGGVLVGEAADRASEMMSALETAGKAGDIAIDDATARLLADRFLIRPRDSGNLLVAEHAAASLGAVDLAGPFVGRERELGYLDGLVREATSERRARTIVVSGAAGAGKSRLVRELLGRLGDEPDVWVLQGDPLTASTPFGMLAPFLRKHAGISRSDASATAIGKLHEVVAGLVPAPDVDRITEFLAELATLSNDGPRSRAYVAATRDATLMGDQMRRALTDFIAASSDERPLVIVLEDAQWSDRATLSFLEAAVRILEARPLCLIVLARPEAKAELVILFGDRSTHDVRLDPLARAPSEQLARSLLGRTSSDEDVARIVDRAGGNPFFLEELVRASSAGASSALPSSVLSVLESRLEALPAEARRTMRAASVFGRAFWQAGLVELLPKVDVASHLDLLERAEIIRRSATSRFDGQIEWTFRHSLLSEASYARLPGKDRERAHRAAARWLEDAGESDPTLLAEHFERGGEEKSAIGLLAGAAHLALEATDLELCIALSARAIRCGASGAELGGILADEAEARQWLGQNPEALASAKRALGLLERGTTAWCRAATVAMTAGSRTHDRQAVSEVLEALLELDAGDGAPSDHLNLVAQAATQLVFLGSLDAADRVLARTPAGLAHRDPGQAAWLLRARAWRALAAGEPAAYGTLMRHSAIAFSEVGDLRNACVQHVNVAYAAVLLGQFEDAISGLRAVIDESKALGLVAVTAVARHNLGIALARAGQLSAGEAEERAAILSFRSQGDHRMLAASLGYLAEILALRGDLAGAEKSGREALEESPERSPVRAITLASLASVLLQRAVTRGEVRARADRRAPADEALTLAREARSLLEALGGVDEGEGLILATYARALGAVGRIDEARAAVSRAAHRVRERAERVGESHRTTFLERVPENVAALTLEELLDDDDLFAEH